MATVLGRRAERAARRGLVDWPRAEEFAIQQLRHAPGTLARADIEATEPVYAAAMASIVDRSRNRVPFFPSQRVTSKSTTWLASMQGSGGT